MKKIVATSIIGLSFLISLSAQLSISCPSQNVDPALVENYTLSIDTTKRALNVDIKRLDKLNILLSYKTYTISFYEMDTIAVLKDKTGEEISLTIRMCQGAEFGVKDKYSGKTRHPFINKNRLDLGDWSRNHLIAISNIQKQINEHITAKGVCNEDRKLKKTVASVFTSAVGKNSDGYYTSGITLPAVNGNSSIEARNDFIQKKIDTCVVYDKSNLAVRVDYRVNENGEAEIFQFDLRNPIPDKLKSQIEACFASLKFTPANYGDKLVKAQCATLIGVNADDKYNILEQLHFGFYSESQVVHIPDEALSRRVEKEEEVEDEPYIIVEQMPELIDPKYFKNLEKKLRKAFPRSKYGIGIKFIVERDGTISNVNILRTSNPEISAWLLDNLESGKLYTPGKQRGRTERVFVNQLFTKK